MRSHFNVNCICTAWHMTGVQEYVPLHPLAAPEAEYKGANSLLP